VIPAETYPIKYLKTRTKDQLINSVRDLQMELKKHKRREGPPKEDWMSNDSWVCETSEGAYGASRNIVCRPKLDPYPKIVMVNWKPGDSIEMEIVKAPGTFNVHRFPKSTPDYDKIHFRK
jgi:hypothetical protein